MPITLLGNNLTTMSLAILILIGAGLYVCIKRVVQATPQFVIRGRSALAIGLALVAVGVFAIVMPVFCAAIGLFDDFVASLLLSLAVVAASLGYIVFVVLTEKRRQAAMSLPPAANWVPNGGKNA